ncbi:MAG TPA: hypothetical protein VLF39_03930 [Candidatus Saccharimonadales bacterium]|nr:hypothetical protein [Candidatus Saccharimonadales bacterium]
MSDLLHEAVHDEPELQPVVEAREVAEGVPHALAVNIDPATGDKIERIGKDRYPSITLISDFEPDVDRLRINAQAKKTIGETDKTYISKITKTHFSDGDSDLRTSVEIHGQHSDGSEYTRISRSPDRAKALGGAIARIAAKELEKF